MSVRRHEEERQQREQKLIAEVELHKANAEQYLQDNVVLHNEKLILSNENQRLREALSYYAEEKHYETDIMLEDNPCDVTEDGGTIARKALAGD